MSSERNWNDVPDDELEETAWERIEGLKEMFPETLRNNVCSTVSWGQWMTCKTVSLTKGLVWVVSAASVVTLLPYWIESELSQLEKEQVKQQQQMLLGPAVMHACKLSRRLISHATIVFSNSTVASTADNNNFYPSSNNSPHSVAQRKDNEVEEDEQTELEAKYPFRRILYHQGELDNSDLSQPPSRRNPHPFNPTEPEVLAPTHARSIVPFVNHLPVLQNLVNLGMDLLEMDKETNIGRFLVRMDWDLDVKPKIHWLIKDLGVKTEDVGSYLTRNPFFLTQQLADMKERVNYLFNKGFNKKDVTKIVIASRYWLNTDVKINDSRLGFLQRQFQLSGNEVRQLTAKEPRVISFGLGPIQRIMMMLNTEFGLSQNQLKHILKEEPRLFMAEPREIHITYNYLSRVMAITNEQLTEYPLALRCPVATLRRRHEFLYRLKKAQYNESLPDYVSLERLLVPSDKFFAEDMKASLVEEGDNPDITKERRKAAFPVNKLAAFIHGGEHIVRRRHEILEIVESRPEFKSAMPLEFMSREQRHEEQARKAVAMTDIATDVIDGSDFFGEGMYYQSLIIGRDLHAMSLHYIMFLQTIQGQTDDEQLEQWIEPTISRSILGTYAQTELGHGTNLKRLETTATYELATQEFVLHSPRISSAKWWPGGLGKSATHAIVMAQLIIKDKCYGPHPFIVQLRHLDTHMPFKSIRVGDIGPKFGINGSDNGFLIFDHHRIPRNGLLMRYAKVLPNGDYVAPKHNKLGYGSMIFVRSVMIRDQAMQLGAAVTIATRYSAIRRQGELQPNASEEVQILDYQNQQYRIFPQIANTIAFLLAASEIRSLYLKVTEQLTTGNIDLLPELHALSSGLKAVVSWEVSKGIEQCRLSCGGHGYSQASAFPEIYAYATGGLTYEGENIVMLLQVAKQLMKAVRGLHEGKPPSSSFIESYLSSKSITINRNAFSSKVDFIKPEDIISCFEEAARLQINNAYTLLSSREKELGAPNAFNSTSIELCRAAKLHVKAYLVRNLFNKISTCDDSAIKPILIELARIFALYHIADSASAFSTILSHDQMGSVRQRMYELLARIRPNAVAIVDSFDFSDRELNSVLGRRDGNVYPALLQWAQQSPLNKEEVTEAYRKHLRPMMVEARSKL
ncbi:acyl-CoA oxidase domain-containing protein [Ditylenchus destructor]|nr:acyl-CoA oxidase domain-containing protein [Ditylenchus destructor]